MFGDEAALSTYIGAYLAVLSTPKSAAPDGQNVVYASPGHLAAIYTAPHLPDARAVFLFSRAQPLEYHHRDSESQKAFLDAEFRALAPEVDSWLDELGRTPSFYFDSVTQLHMDSWSREPGHPRRRRRLLPGASGRRQYHPGRGGRVHPRR